MSRGEEATSVVTEQEVVSVMRYLAAAYPRREIEPQTVAVYVMQLIRSQLPPDALLLAAMNLIDESEWFPTVAELRAETARIVTERENWFLTANYRLYGHPIPDELFLPPGMAREVIGYELERVDLREALGYPPWQAPDYPRLEDGHAQE